MKKLLTLALAGVALAVLNGVGIAQEARQAQGPQRQVPCPKLTKVKVLKVNESAKTITVMAEGKELTFNAANLRSLPKLGESIGMWVIPTGQPEQRVVCVPCNCPPPGQPGPCDECCFDFKPLPPM